ncbi:MAG: DUF58 domain-containing protein, partial [Bdellovibrionota bacterium]
MRSFFAPTIRGAEALLVEELTSMGATDVKEESGGVAFAGPLRVAYHACLWSRLASRILLKIGGPFPAATPEALYGGIRHIHWPSTAHRGELMVSEVEAEPSGDLWIVLDLNGAAHRGTGSKSTL